MTPHPAEVESGQTVELTAVAEDENGQVLDDVFFQWSTGNPKIATVDDHGVVTGVGRGVAVVIASTDRGIEIGWATVNVSSSEPPAAGLALVDVSLGSHHGCGIATDGKTYCWGNNTYGQLGEGSVHNRLVPTAVDTDQKFAEVVVGAHHSCGRAAEGEVWCWGNNSSGQLGTGGLLDSKVPVKVSGGHVFTALRAGGNANCGITDQGEGLCWGSAYTGETAAGFSGGVLVAPMGIALPAAP